MGTWQLQEAKNKLSRVVDLANSAGAQVITRHGREVAVVLSWDDYGARVCPSGDLVEFLLTGPLPASGLVIERDGSLPRPAPVL
ncbi:MAG: type II toxin-antitoxin system Phd/YefM family antitoxin [Armatimonadetes bacterium]|nr:type II toxin-antitoxin system Phd/YefM family antitoxin [Armatimonadota bacterium]